MISPEIGTKLFGGVCQLFVVRRGREVVDNVNTSCSHIHSEMEKMEATWITSWWKLGETDVNSLQVFTSWDMCSHYVVLLVISVASLISLMRKFGMYVGRV